MKIAFDSPASSARVLPKLRPALLRDHPRLGPTTKAALTTSAYNEKCSRNIGWVTKDEQKTLRSKRIAIAGLGGVGGSHLLTLTRLGIGKFHIADLDTFEDANFNRQIGATRSSLGKPKVEVLAQMAKGIHEDLAIQSFADGVNDGNVQAFLKDVDVYVDGLDFFAVKARQAVFAACHRQGIPAVTAAPLGMGTAVLCFMPGQMSFEEYFRMDGQSEIEQLKRFLVGVAPASLQSPYLVDPSTIDLANHRGPSTPMGCDLCAGAAGAQVLKILLGRGDVLAAPRGMQFDAFRNSFVQTRWEPWEANDPAAPLDMAKAAACTVVETT